MSDPADAPRMSPRPVSEWDEDVLDAFAGGDPSRRDAPPPKGNIIGLYAWHPDLIRGWWPYSNHLRASSLPDRARELLILRTSWIRDGEYEWGQHRRLGAAAGLSAEDIARVGEGPDAPGWSALDAAMLRAVDELCHDRMLSDATWAELSAELDRRQLLDLLFTIGTYDMHCAVFNTLGLQLDPDLEGFDR